MAVFTAIGAAVFGAGTFMAAVTAAGLQLVAGIAVSAIGKAMQGEPQGSKFGVQGKLQAGEDVPRSYALGESCTAGSLPWHGTFGAGGTMSARVIALYDLPIRELRYPIVGGVDCTLLKTEAHPDFGWPVSEYRKGGVDHLWIKFYDGTQTVADPFLVGEFGDDADRPYEASRVGRGCAYAIVFARAPERNDEGDKPLFQGIPEIKFVTYGTRWYNPALDSTVGGAGAHRWDDPSTWGGVGDFNPIVQLYNLKRGVGDRVSGAWFYGMQGTSSARLPTANWIAGILAAQAGISGPNGAEPTYRAGGEIQVGAQVAQTEEALLTAANARLVENGGVYTIFVGPPGAPVMAFSDDDILSTEEQSFSPFLSLADTVNGLVASYPNPAEGWNVKKYTKLRPDLEPMAGNRRLVVPISLDLVPYKGQVQRLVKWAIDEAQRARRHTFVLGPEFRVIEPGDVVRWTSVRNGYVDKLFRVDGAIYKSNLDVIVDLTEVDPSDYDWEQGADYTPVIDGPLQLVGPKPMPMQGWQVFPVLVDGKWPSVEVRSATGVPGVQRVRVQVRVDDETGQLIFDSDAQPYADPWRWVLQGQFPPSTLLVVRGIFVGPPAAEWSGWFEVTTNALALTTDDLSADLQSTIDGVNDWLDEGLPALADTLESIDGDIAAINAEVDANFSTLNNSIGIVQAQVNDVFAADSWVNTKTYPKDDIVQYSGALYRAKQAVPVNTVPTNTTYWEKIGNYTGLGAAVAGTANLLTSEVARIDGVNSSQGTSITALQNALPGKADASAVTALTTRVTSAENVNTSQGTAITGLQNALPGKADGSVVSALDSRVTSAENVNTSQGSAITGLTNTINDSETGLATKASNTALNSLTSRVTDAEGAITTQGSAITSLNSTVAGKADATALTSLETKVTQQGDNLVSTSRDTRHLQNALLAAAMLNAEQGQSQVLERTDQLAATAAVSETVRTEVSRIDGTTTALAEQINVVQAQVENDIATAISSVTTQVQAVDGRVTAESQRLDQLQTQVNTDIATAISGVTTQVQTVDGRVTAESQRVDQLRVVVGDSSGTFLAKTEVVAAPAGVSVRHVLRLQATNASGQTVQVLQYFDIMPDGSTRIGFSASNVAFFLADGTPVALFDQYGDFRNPAGTVRISMLANGGGDFSFG